MLKAYGWDPIAAALEAARRRHPSLSELLGVYEDALRLVHGAGVEIDLSRIEPSRGQMRLTQGQPMLGREEFVVDLGATGRLFDDLGRLLAGRPEGPAEALGRIRHVMREGRLTIEALVRRSLAGPGGADALAEELEVEPQLLRFLARWSLWPSLEACASGLEEWVAAIGWDGNLCPVCGSGAGLAELRGDEGARVLHCSFCGWSWAFQRTGCPYCGNTDHERLEMLYAAEDRRAHLSVCHACKAYLKTVDNKEFRGLIPEVEDLASPYLDIVAGERGYQRVLF